jgi:hypothetical protein
VPIMCESLSVFVAVPDRVHPIRWKVNIAAGDHHLGQLKA